MSERPLIALTLLSVLLSACAVSPSESTDDRLGRLVVAPGKYVLYTCPEIATQAAASAARARQLEALMTKANVDASGQLVSSLTYRPEYLEKRGEMNELRNAAIAKNCKSVPAFEAVGERTSDSAVR